MRRSLTIICVAAVTVACGAKSDRGAPAAAPPSQGAGGIDLDAMDPRVKPGDDFYRYANGTWLARTDIPGDRATWGTGAVVAERTDKRVADLVRDAGAQAPAGSDARKVGDFYSTFMDEAAIESNGLSPLRPALDRIAAITDATGLARELGASIRADVDALNNTNFETSNIFGLWVAQDLSDPSKYSPFLLQGGLGMPNREYYLDASQRMADIRVKYEAYIKTLFDLAQQPEAAAKAKRVAALEQQIAKAHGSREDSADVLKSNNH